MADYQPLRTDEKVTTTYRDSVDEENFHIPPPQRPTLSSRLGNGIWVLHLVLLLTSGWMFFSAQSQSASTLQHVKEYSAWSPAQKAVEYESVKYNLSTHGNRFSGKGPEVDQAWMEISYDMGDQFLDAKDLDKLGMPTSSLKVAHPTTGKEGYRVGMEVFHQLHCLNLLRKVTYKEYYESEGGELSVSREALQKHTDHCLEVLRVNTMCTADIGVFTLYLVDGDPLAWPQLNSNHKCRNFDRVLDWAHEHSVGNMEVL